VTLYSWHASDVTKYTKHKGMALRRSSGGRTYMRQALDDWPLMAGVLAAAEGLLTLSAGAKRRWLPADRR
jgi:hypothetical protein